MKTWNSFKTSYPEYLQSKGVKTLRRVSSLQKIEQFCREENVNLPEDIFSFLKKYKEELKMRFESWKGKKINGAESQAFNDFFNWVCSK